MKPVLPVDHKLGTLPDSYRKLAVDFIHFAIQHSGPIHGPGPNNSVYFIGTYWDDPPGKNRADIEVTSRALFINPVIAVISAEEHADEFPSNPPDKVLMGRAEQIINDTDAQITIHDPNGKTSDFSLGQLQRIQSLSGRKQELMVGSNVWPNYRQGGKVNACWDGYFLAFEDLEKGTYNIELDSDSPYFGRPGRRYHSLYSYGVTVK